MNACTCIKMQENYTNTFINLALVQTWLKCYGSYKHKVEVTIDELWPSVTETELAGMPDVRNQLVPLSPNCHTPPLQGEYKTSWALHILGHSPRASFSLAAAATPPTVRPASSKIVEVTVGQMLIYPSCSLTHLLDEIGHFQGWGQFLRQFLHLNVHVLVYRAQDTHL